MRIKDKCQTSALVSIIIPMYNRPYLIKSIWQNLSKQCYTNFEIIFVDDGSEIPIKVPSYFDLNYNLIRYEKNRGPGFARRIGRERANGKYIAYLDSDDWWSDNFLVECVNDLFENPNAGMVYTGSSMLKDTIEIYNRTGKNIPNTILPSLFERKKRSWSTSSCLWRADTSLASHWKDLRNNEDYIHDLYASSLNNSVVYNENALTYKNQSASDRIERDGQEVKKALEELLRIRKLPNYNYFDNFLFRRIYDFKLSLNLLLMPSLISKVYRANRNQHQVFLKKSFIIILISFFGIRRVRFKKTFNY